MSERIYLSAPDVGDAEQQAAARAIASGWVAPLGPEVDAFEREVAARVGVQHGVALSSGTAGLHLGLITLGVKPGDWVITSTLTFVATANAISYVGARPYFIDAEADSGNINPELVRAALDKLRYAGEPIGALVPVDLLGHAANYVALGELAAEYSIPVLSDAAESLGADFNGVPAGGWGDAAVVSFNGNKIMTTSGGGMLLTNDAEQARRARFLATQARDTAPHYEHSVTGYNYRLSNVLAAIGRAQLARLDDMIARRRSLFEAYAALFAQVPGVDMFQQESKSHDNCWLTAILVDPNVTGWKAQDLALWLEDADIESRPLWKPMHLQPLFAGARGEIDGTAEVLFDRGLALPSGSVLSEADRHRVFGAIREFLRNRG